MSPSFIKPLWDGQNEGHLSEFESATKVQSKSGAFALCLASSKLSEIDGISFAGLDAEARRITPALDAEMLLSGSVKSARSIPVSPLGVVSPVVISKAMLNLTKLPAIVFNCGVFQAPMCSHISISQIVANDPRNGRALDLDLVRFLVGKGREFGSQIAGRQSYLLIGECVPGGTTTALGVLRALGFDVGSMLSSSLPQPNHSGKQSIIVEAFINNRKDPGFALEDPLQAISYFGDPMQAFVLGMAMEASSSIPVLLAGGSQMLAIWLLLGLIVPDIAERPLLIGMTKWVAFDPGAQVAELASMFKADAFASCPDFNLSKHQGLALYEKGNVKEGVGAGGLMLLAHVLGNSPDEIMNACDKQYDQIVAKAKS